MKSIIHCLRTVFAIIVLGVFVLFPAACGGSHDNRLAQLEELERQNSADSLMTNDSLAKVLVSYFDDHGTPNEAMRAHYILGRTYADLGESPAALNAYLDAADHADTTAADCDYRTLSRVYGQMAGIYNEHLLYRHSLSAKRNACHFALKSKDTLSACIFLENQVSDYCQLGLEDSALIVSRQAVKMFEEYGDTLAANSSLAPVIMILANRKDYVRMKEYLDKYEHHSHLFNQDTLMYDNQYLLYYYKGLYSMGVQSYDSAAFHFHRILERSKSLNNKGLGAEGLYTLYKQLGVTDSIVYYANLYTTLNDSMATMLEKSMVYRQQLLFNYTRYQQQALQMKQLANREHTHVLFLLGLLLFTFILFLLHRRLSVMKIREFKLKAIVYHQILEKNEAKDRSKTKAEQSPASLLYCSSIRQRLMDKAMRGECATEEDWTLVAKELSNYYPAFIDTLRGFLPSLNVVHFRICLGLRLHLSPAHISVLVARSKQAVTSARKRMYKDAFGKEGTPSEFDDFISSIS